MYKSLKKHLTLNIIISLIFSVLYAISDEIHQGFTAGRFPAIQDVVIDSIGALCGIFITVFMFYIFHIKKALNNQN